MYLHDGGHSRTSKQSVGFHSFLFSNLDTVRTLICAASRKKVPKSLSHCHTKRRRSFFWYDTGFLDFFYFWKCFYPSFGMTTQDFRDLFVCRRPNLDTVRTLIRYQVVILLRSQGPQSSVLSSLTDTINYCGCRLTYNWYATLYNTRYCRSPPWVMNKVASIS